jgi:uncharacterized membrane protein YcaP (DUF421 family)
MLIKGEPQVIVRNGEPDWNTMRRNQISFISRD